MKPGTTLEKGAPVRVYGHSPSFGECFYYDGTRGTYLRAIDNSNRHSVMIDGTECVFHSRQIVSIKRKPREFKPGDRVMIVGVLESHTNSVYPLILPKSDLTFTQDGRRCAGGPVVLRKVKQK